MSRYTQLTQEQRYQTYALKKVGHTQAEIARTVGVHKSTISRELRRNSGRKGYRPKSKPKSWPVIASKPKTAPVPALRRRGSGVGGGGRGKEKYAIDRRYESRLS
uniref:Helix-turn-helix domain-containing protein n=1 Tax=Candidatus Kentrum sp. TC TaxID=2126339 RepID=A0A451A841_9GAMM|nr:MAG: Helix-turn-helix domain-containing protein [Candidatus Kentron sp. TC]